MVMLEERTGLTLVKSSSRDARVGCETLSQTDVYLKPEFLAVEKWQSGDDSDTEYGEQERGYEDRHVEGARGHFFSCFIPRTAMHLFPHSFGSPGRYGQGEGRDFRGRSKAQPSVLSFSGPISHSGPIGSVPHSGPIKISTGPIIGHSGTSKGFPKGHSGPFTMIPPEVIGKKNPAGYESEDPTSPEVTCVGRVRIKPKFPRKSVGTEKNRKDRQQGKSSKKKESSESTGVEKRSFWKIIGRKHRTNESKKGPVFEFDLNRFSSFSQGTSLKSDMIDDASVIHSEVLSSRQEYDANERVAEAEDVSESQAAPANSLFSMKGSHRNDGQDRESNAPPPNALLLMRGSSRNRSRQDQETPIIPFLSSDIPQDSEPNAPPPNALLFMRGSSRNRSR
eukprot:c21797_g2_i1 orf=246-1424(+)